jgi:selenium metabolism protein YedF
MAEGAALVRSGTVVVVNGETMGRGDDGLGAKLLASFLGTAATVDPKPDAIVFYNAAVKLLGPASRSLDPLRQLDAAGVDLLACVTCLEFYGLTQQIQVGRVSNMREIVQRTMEAGKVWTL